MKAISLWQPWASAIAAGVKTLETRHWQTPYRGPLAIHAAKRKDASDHGFFDALMCDSRFRQAMNNIREWSYLTLPRGAVVAVCDLVCIVPVEEVADTLDPLERTLGNYASGRFAWGLENVVWLEVPHHTVGRQGLFNVPIEDPR